MKKRIKKEPKLWTTSQLNAAYRQGMEQGSRETTQALRETIESHLRIKLPSVDDHPHPGLRP